MKNMQKMLGVLLAVLLVFSMMPMSALAVETGTNEAAIGTVEYATLKEAIDAAQAGQTVKLLADADLSAQKEVAISKKLNIDLAGKTLKVPQYNKETNSLGLCNTAEITLSDSVGTGKLVGTIYAGAKVNINSGDYTQAGLGLNNGGSYSLSGGRYAFVYNSDLAKGHEYVKQSDGSFLVQPLGPVALQGEGTKESPYLIQNLADLKTFRDTVNGGNYLNGKFVKLTADIDLNNEEWIPIGGCQSYERGFAGDFDGGNHTISNLSINRPKDDAHENYYTGLFGFTTGTTKLHDFTLNNVNITGYMGVGAVAGNLTGAAGSFDNIHVTGSIMIDAIYYVGGITGGGYANITNCSVVGDPEAFSMINSADGFVGGIIGKEHEGNLQIANCTVKNVDVWGGRYVGSIAGFIAYDNVMSDCVAENVGLYKIEEPDAKHNNRQYIGAFAGGFNNADTNGKNSVKPILRNCTFEGTMLSGTDMNDVLAADAYVGDLYSGIEDDGDSCTVENCTIVMPANNVAEVNGVCYETMDAALAALVSANGGTIKLLNDVTLPAVSGNDAISIPQGMTVDLDLNGKALNASLRTGSADRHNYAIGNHGTLTIKDTVGGGKITGRGVENYGTMTLESGELYAVDKVGGAAIWNEGNLTVNGGGLFVTGEDQVGTPSDNYGVGCLNNSGKATITGGTFKSVNRRTYAIISTGEIEITPAEGKEVVVEGAHGGLAIDGGTAVVNGGSYSSSDFYGLYVSNDGMGTEPQKAAVTVNGGTFSGKKYAVLVGSDNNNPVNSTVSIRGGKFNQPLETEKNTSEGAISVSGGQFAEAVAPEHCAPGFEPQANADGTFGVDTIKVAEADGVQYASLQEAVRNGSNIKLLKDIYLTEDTEDAIIKVNKPRTVDFNGHTIFVSHPAVHNIAVFQLSGGRANLTLKDTSPEGKGGIQVTEGESYCVHLNISGVRPIANAALTIENGVYHGAATVVNVQMGRADILGGHFSVIPTTEGGKYDYLLNCIDNAFTNNKAKIVVKGGTFEQFDPAHSNSEPGGETSFLADGYVSEAAGTTYTVRKANYVAEVNGQQFESLQAAIDAAQAGQTVVLLQDVVIDPQPGESGHLAVQMTVNKDLILNMNGKKLSLNQEKAVDSFTGVPVFFSLLGDAHFTITGDGTIDCEFGNNSAYGINTFGQNAKLTVMNGTFLGAPTVFQVQQGMLEVKGGRFDMSASCKQAAPQLANYIINCIDKSYQDGTASIAVSGGTFVGFDPSANPEGAGTSYLAKGYEAVQTGDSFAVDTIKVAEVGGVKYDSLPKAVTAAKDGQTIKLLNDITITEDTAEARINVFKKITVDFNGHTIHLDHPGNSNWAVFFIGQNGDVTLQGEGGIRRESGGNYCVHVAHDTAKLTILSGDYYGDTTAINLHKGDVYIKGGHFDVNPYQGKNTYLLNCIDKSFKDGLARFHVMGGTYEDFDPAHSNSEPGGETSFLADGYVSEAAGTTYTVRKANYVAEVNGQQFESLQAAIDAAQAGQTVVLLKDYEGNGVKVLSGKNVIIDFGGHTYTINTHTVGSAGTETNGFQLLNDSNIVLKNGTLNAGTSAKILVQNYSNLTLDNMKLVGGTQTQYVLSNNCGDTVIKGNSSITATEGNFAFDSCKFGSHTIPNVTVENGTITGKVELTGGNLFVKDGQFNGAFDVQSGKASISGGQFSHEVQQEWCAEGFRPMANSDGTYGVELDPNVAIIVETGAKFETVEAALAAAEAGQTVQMIKDSMEDGRLMLDNQLTLDLNGHKLKARSFVAFEGNNLIDSQKGKGVLLIPRNRLVLDTNNIQLPVWNEANGYQFSAYKMDLIGFDQANGGEQNKTGTEFTACAKPLFNTFARELFKNGCKDNAIEISLRLTWTTEDGQGGQDFVFNEAFVQEVYKDGSGLSFALTVIAPADIAEIQITSVVTTECGVEIVSAPIIFTYAK